MGEYLLSTKSLVEQTKDCFFSVCFLVMSLLPMSSVSKEGKRALGLEKRPEILMLQSFGVALVLYKWLFKPKSFSEFLVGSFI